MSLLAAIEKIYPLRPEIRAEVLNAFEEIVRGKGEYLVQPGQVCRHLYFLEKGALRGSYLLDGKEITHWFSFGPDFVTSFHSFSTGAASVESIQLLEGSVLHAISRDRLMGLLDRNHELERLLRIAYEQYYIRLEERFINGQFRSAGERYEEALAQRPELVSRVPLGFLASYLGISPETLSRIRARI